MIRVTHPLLTACALAALLAGSAPAGAQERSALVIANTGYAGDLALPALRRDTEKMSETLFGLGFSVTRLENVDAARMRDALAGVGDVDIVYFAGHGFAHEGESYLLPLGASSVDPADLAAGSVAVTPLIEAGNRIVMLDTCHGPASQGLPGAGALDGTLAEGAGPDLLLMTAAPPGVPCAQNRPDTLTALLLERLSLPGLPSTELLPLPPAPIVLENEDGTETEVPAAVPVAFSTLTEPFVFRRATSGATLTREDYEILEAISPAARAQLLAMWEAAGIAVDFAGEVGEAPTEVTTVTDDTVQLVQPVRPATSATTVSPVTTVSSVSSVGTVSDGVSIFTAQPTTQAGSTAARPVPGAGGLPAPSIIVGYPEQAVEASFETAAEDSGPVGGNEISYENVTLRREFAENNRELYLSLVNSGAFDPPQPQLVVALQTEMKRMNCYTAAIDGDWGRGSRASVARYYTELGESGPDPEPTIDLWRQLMLKDDVRCPDVVVAQPQRTQSTTTSTRRTQSSTPRRTQSAPAPAPTPAPAPSQPRRTISNSSGTGVFR